MYDRILNMPLCSIVWKAGQELFLIILQYLKTYHEDLSVAFAIFHEALQQGVKKFVEIRDKIIKFIC